MCIDVCPYAHTSHVLRRYIHHYTRYKAHWDSSNLEAKMSQDAQARIEHTLARSIHTHRGEIVLNDSEYVTAYANMKGDGNMRGKGGANMAGDSEGPLKWLTRDTSFSVTDTCVVYPLSVKGLRLVHAYSFINMINKYL